MQVALTGASGFIGSVTARRLKEAGHRVTALVRETSRRDHIEDVVDRFVVGNQDDERAWSELAEGADAIVHNSVDWSPIREKDFDRHLQTNLIGSIRFMRETAPRQFIFVSTIAVHHDMRPRWEGRPDEDHPIRPVMDYGAYKAAVESHLWVDHFRDGRNTCAVRPCGVYGVDPNLDRSHGYDLLKKIVKGEKLDKPGGGKFVHVEDVAGAITACVGNDHAAGKPFNLVDCYARWADWAKFGAEIMGKEVEIDFSSPDTPKNVFSKEQSKSLGVGGDFLDRGHEGIRSHLEELAQRMKSEGVI